jgi:hypothetical protein
VTLTDAGFANVCGEADTSVRDADGRYLRHIVETFAGRPQAPDIMRRLSGG